MASVFDWMSWSEFASKEPEGAHQWLHFWPDFENCAELQTTRFRRMTGGDLLGGGHEAQNQDGRQWSRKFSTIWACTTRIATIVPTDAEAHAMASVLHRAFDDVNVGHEPLHDFEVTVQCGVREHWYALARKAIELGAKLPKDSP